MANKYNMELFRMKARLCKTFADPKRLVIINELRSGEKMVGGLANTLEISQAVVSRNLAILRDRGVVVARREGTNIFYHLADPKIGEACEMMHTILLNQIAKNKDLAEELMVEGERNDK